MRLLLASAALLLLAACSDTAEPVGPSLIVYVADDEPVNLAPLFAEFTSDTGIPIAPVWGKSSANTDTVIAKQGAPADVLITSTVADIVRAADKGALRPIDSGLLINVRSEFKDPDDLWVSLAHRHTLIAISPGTHSDTGNDYAALAEDANEGKLCLSSIANSVNQTLIAWLIEEFDRKPAERIVRGWVRNLALPPFSSEAELVTALESGVCQIGIVSMHANMNGVLTLEPVPQYLDVSAMGIGRHAQSPERAQQLIDWLILNRPLEDFGAWQGKNVAIAGWRNEEARLLAERAGYN